MRISYCLILRLFDLFRRHIYLKCLIPMRSYGSKMEQLIGISYNQKNSIIASIGSRNMWMNSLVVENRADVRVV